MTETRLNVPLPDESEPSGYSWFMLALLTAICAFVASVPMACMPPLFKEIATDLHLDLVQVGGIWGIAGLAGIVVSIIGGVLADRLNVKYFLGIACILVGITGALRGLADSFFMLALFVFINGIIRLIIPVAANKVIGLWFHGKRLGMALGIGAMGMGFGLMLGTLMSATVLSPALGGWRNVMYLYGGISAFIGVLWLVFGRAPEQKYLFSGATEKMPISKGLASLIRNKAIWCLGALLFFRVASIMGMMGYVPTYLRDQGWTPASADGALTLYYAVSTLCVVPLSTLSDRLGSRKTILLIGLIISGTAIGLIPFVSGAGVLVMMIASGIFMDGFMAIFTTMVLETKGVGAGLSGTALGMTFTIAQIGSVISPPIGNSLDVYGNQWPFIFWAAAGAAALIPLMLTSETGKRKLKKLEL